MEQSTPALKWACCLSLVNCLALVRYQIRITIILSEVDVDYRDVPSRQNVGRLLHCLQSIAVFLLKYQNCSNNNNNKQFLLKKRISHHIQVSMLFICVEVSMLFTVQCRQPLNGILKMSSVHFNAITYLTNLMKASCKTCKAGQNRARTYNQR